MPTQAELDAYYRSRYRAEYKGAIRLKLKHAYRNGKRAITRYELIAALGYKSGGGGLLEIGAGSGVSLSDGLLGVFDTSVDRELAE